MTATTPTVPLRDEFWVDTRDTAKLVRARLKAEFPGVKFSVTISRYSMGSSVHVAWTDGPVTKAVDQVVDVYSGTGFDGMIDATTYNTAWLFEDGTAQRSVTGENAWGGPRVVDLDGEPIAEEERRDYQTGLRLGAGVTNTTTAHVDPLSLAFARGKRDGARRVATGARLVRFGGSVSTQRRLSDEYRAELGRAVLFLDRHDTPGPFADWARYDLSIAVPGQWDDNGNILVWRLSELDPAEFAEAMRSETARRAHNAAVRAGSQSAPR